MFCIRTHVGERCRHERWLWRHRVEQWYWINYRASCWYWRHVTICRLLKENMYNDKIYQLDKKACKHAKLCLHIW